MPASAGLPSKRRHLFSPYFPQRKEASMSILKPSGSRILMAAALALCLLLTGCGSKVSKDNFEKIKPGMTQAEVEAILGTGTISNSQAASVPGMGNLSAKVETWTDGDKQIAVTYMNDKVQGTVSKGL